MEDVGVPDLAAIVEAVFADDGPIARALPGFEPRDGQRRMADAVASVVDAGGTLLAEAGTGTGKTLAYLIPAILSRHRVLVSTGTKNLQEQIYFKDLPALRDALGVPFTATLMKGRSNYLCLHRLDAFGEQDDDAGAGLFGGVSDIADERVRGNASERMVFLPIVREWAAATATGDRAELRDLPEDVALWKELSADADACLGNDCPRYADCFVTRMRQRAAESDVVIVNHHLLCADASVRESAYGEVIPSCATLVVDEAHQLEDVATQYFGISFSGYRVDDLVRDGERILATGELDLDQTRAVTAALVRTNDAARQFLSGISLARAHHPALEPRVRYTADAIADHAQDGFALSGALEQLEAALARVRTPQGDDLALPPNEAAAAIERRARELRSDLRFLLRADDADFVYYVEQRGASTRSARSGEGRGLFLRASPVDVSRIVQRALFDRFRTIVLTSATLAVDESFAYVKRRLGIGEAMELRVASEFDFARQALLYLPRRMPPPKSPTFAEAVAREAVALLTRSQGRAFVLFTSYKVLRAVQPFIEMAVAFPVLVQGTAPRSALIDEFRATPNAILLATSSFWQGVDVAGEALSCVVIDKLPFASPGDPVTAARIDAIAAHGGDAFGEYQVPLAILTLQQGLGRLIRHRGDRGVLAILDPRLRTMGYGRRFLASLPPAPVTSDLNAVDRFFK
jgi:ATP-dependent DNA helicase DinG